MGVPEVTAVFATIIEFFGGIFLVLGFLVPIVSGFVMLLFVSIIIVKLVKMKASYVTFSRDKPSFEIDAFYLALAVVLFFLGAGVASLDSFLGTGTLLW